MATGVGNTLAGPNASAPWTTFDWNTANFQVDMDDLISLLSPSDIPLQGGLGGDGDLTLPTGVCFETQVNWMDETLLIPRTTLAATAITADTQITVASGDKFRFGPGDLILLDSETVRVTALGTGDLLTVTRAVQGSAAQHSNGSDAMGLGTALPEGSDPTNAKFNDRNFRSNLTQIFGPEKIEASGTDQVVRKYGVSNEFAKQAANRMKELAVAVENAIINGSKFVDSTTANRWRAMGGILGFTTTNVDSSTTTITEAAISTQSQNCYTAGGDPKVLMLGPVQKPKVSAFTSGGTIQVMRPDGTRGVVVDVLENDFTVLMVKLHRWMRKSEAVMFERSQGELCTLRPMTFEPLGKTGDSNKAQIVGEKTLRWFRERHGAKFTALT